MILIEPTIQTKFGRTLRPRMLTAFLAQAAAAVKLPGDVSVLLTTDARIRRLNREFRHKDQSTDVLSFPAPPPMNGQPDLAGDLAGDLAISVPTAARQAADAGHLLFVELEVLLLHGLLHLAGFDHESDTGQMARRETLLRKKLGLPSGLIERSAISTRERARP